MRRSPAGWRFARSNICGLGGGVGLGLGLGLEDGSGLALGVGVGLTAMRCAANWRTFTTRTTARTTANTRATTDPVA